MDRQLKKLIEKTAQKHNLSIVKAELVILSQFKFTRNIIEDGEFKSIRLMHLGKFVSSPKRIKQREDKKKKDELL